MTKPILCLDFDGVIHSYTSGWQGADVIPDPPVDGAMDFIWEATEHFTVAIFSSRTNQRGGLIAMQRWLREHFMQQFGHRLLAAEDTYRDITWPVEKPPALVTLDDRALTFTGTWPSMEFIKAFKPWNKRI
jgi:hypothetical protein